jgi:hypothetical protein
MTLDIVQAAALARGMMYTPGPFAVEGVFVEPPTQTRSTQATGAAGASAYRGAYTGGRIKVHEKVYDIAGAEVAVITENGALTSGQAVWCTLVAVQHRISGAVSLVWVRGTAAVVASAAVPTHAEIVAELDLDDSATYFILGDLMFYRSGDLVVTHRVSDERRPAYVDEANKEGLVFDETDQSNMGEEYGGVIEVQAGLVQLSGVAAGSMYIDGLALPKWPFGGRIVKLEYIPAVNGTGAGATQDVIVNIDGTPTTGGTLTLTLANAVIPTPVSSTITGANKFKAGDGLDLEVDNAGTDFTAGSGTFRVHLQKYVRR